MLLLAVTLAAIGGVSIARRNRNPSMVDWELAARLARRLGGDPRARRPDAALDARYEAIVHRSFEAVSEYTGTRLSLDGSSVRALGRDEWIDVNLGNFRTLLAPLVEAYAEAHDGAGTVGYAFGIATRYGVTGQLSLLLGFLSRRVLGQYDIPILEPDGARPAIYFVDQNVRALARKAGLDIEDLRLWVALHESTHAFQFRVGEPPWLREHTAGLMRAYLREAVRSLRQSGRLGARIRERMRRLSRDDFRTSSVMRLALTDEQAEILGRIQALMTLMEGYSNHVMHATGARIIDDYERLASRMKVREASRGAAFRVISRLLGLDMKLEQYRVGEAFVDAVVRKRGLDFMNRVWDGPAGVPTLAETRDPAAWIERMERSAGT